jgi:hypothetical protein
VHQSAVVSRASGDRILASHVLSLWFMHAASKVLAIVSALCFGGCAGPDESAPIASALGGESSLRGQFDRASLHSGVPAELLATISYVQTRLQPVTPDEHAHGATAIAGLMGLAVSGDGPWTLDRAAAEVGLDADELVGELEVTGAAAILGRYGDDLGARANDLRSWRPVLVEIGGTQFADEVMQHMGRGWRGLDADRLFLVMTARDVGASVPDGVGTLTQGVGYPGAIWNPAHSSNYSNSSRGASAINYVVIHTTQGSYGGTISWFKNSSSNVSSHYVARSSDGELTQMVDDQDVAWHDGCFNTNSIGIEHEGFVNAPDVWYTEAMYTQSAKLTAWLCDTYGIPKDRAHIMGHAETPDCSDHTDPGSGWDWNHYMALVSSGGMPTFGANYVDQSAPSDMVSGQEAVVYFEFKNESNITWGLNDTRLGTADPMDRDSPFFVDGNWMSPSRATGADHSNYAPGAVGRFTFAIKAPAVDQPTTYTESFQLVQEGVQWFGPVVSMTITVTPEGWTEPDPDPDPNPDGPGPGDTDPDGPDPDGSESGGCSAGGGAPAGGCAILLLGVFVACSRRRR